MPAIVDAKTRRPPLRYALSLEREDVVDVLLADPRVTEAQLASLGTCRGPETRFVLERSERGFTLAGRASEPGVWEPGAYAVLRAQVRPSLTLPRLSHRALARQGDDTARQARPSCGCPRWPPRC